MLIKLEVDYLFVDLHVTASTRSSCDGNTREGFQNSAQ